MEEYDVTAYISGHDHNLQVSYPFKGCLKVDNFSRLEAVSHNAQNEWNYCKCCCCCFFFPAYQRGRFQLALLHFRKRKLLQLIHIPQKDSSLFAKVSYRRWGREVYLTPCYFVFLQRGLGSIYELGFVTAKVSHLGRQIYPANIWCILKRNNKARLVGRLWRKYVSNISFGTNSFVILSDEVTPGPTKYCKYTYNPYSRRVSLALLFGSCIIHFEGFFAGYSSFSVLSKTGILLFSAVIWFCAKLYNNVLKFSGFFMVTAERSLCSKLLVNFSRYHSLTMLEMSCIILS